MTGEPTTVKGKCLCGAVTFAATTKTNHIGACHCSMCRTWSGGVVFALEDASDLKISGEENMTVYKSSDWGERCFCGKCGTNLFWRSSQFGHTAVMAGALEDQAGLKFVSEIFVDAKPAHYAFANDTKKMTEAEFLAQFAGAGGSKD